MKKTKFILVTVLALFTLAVVGCSSQIEDSSADMLTIKVGASPVPHAEILESVKPILAEKGINLEIEIFTDYTLQNTALDLEDIDANFFQHNTYLQDFNQKNNTNLINVASIHFEPLGIYGGKSDSLDNLPKGASIGIPNDTTNMTRALKLLDANNLIKLNPDADINATLADISENPNDYKIEELEAAQLPRSLPDLDIAVINGNYALSADIGSSGLVAEDVSDEMIKGFSNILVVKDGSQAKPEVIALIEALESEEVKAFISDTYGIAVIPV